MAVENIASFLARAACLVWLIAKQRRNGGIDDKLSSGNDPAIAIGDATYSPGCMTVIGLTKAMMLSMSEYAEQGSNAGVLQISPVRELGRVRQAGVRFVK